MIKAVRGFKDILPEEIPYYRFIEEKIKGILENFGFREIRIPVLEHIEVFERSIGNTTDIVEKEMYTLKDKGGEILALRPEATAGIVRSLIENALHLKCPVLKFYFSGPMFRYERPQAGRLRQFHQFNVEVFGIKEASLDAEVVALLYIIFQELGIEKHINLEINHLGCKECRPIYKSLLINFLSSKKEKLCKDCKRRMERNPLRVLDCKNPECKEVTLQAPKICEHLCTECRRYFGETLDYLNILGIPYTINPMIVRGLDYYTGIVFEAISTEIGAQSAVAAGGRYDNLVEDMGGPPIPGIGFAIGEERAVMLLKKEKKVKEEDPRVFFAVLGEEAKRTMIPIVFKLRLKGIKCEMEHDCRKSLKSQMRKADKIKAKYAVITGEEEVKEGFTIVRNMESKEQFKVKIEELVRFFEEVER
ncbi:MAG: histidine--tRNA ligase [Thermosulfidibacteraceae bacterium]|jgi:histidyl-tRNA synthetase